MRCPAYGHDNPPRARFCLECGVSLASAASDAALPGERRQLTVLFCDLVGATSLSQKVDAEEWRDVLARYQTAAAGAVARWGGHVAKNLGDGLLVYFGWPRAREDDPERAVRAGLSILEAMASLDAEDPTMRLAVRLGLHTGPVVIADGGEVFGETANVAARVQSVAEPDTVVVTAATHRLVAGMFVVEDRGPQMLRGVREPVTLYRVIRPSGVRSRLDVAAGRLAPFVGREAEMATLVDRWERAREGVGQSVFVVGEAGVGKSRLVHELRERLADVPHTWLECAATPYTEGTPFHPIIGLVSQGLGLAPEDTGAEKLQKLERGLGALRSVEAVGLLAEFLGLPSPTRLGMSPELQRRRTIDLLGRWSLALSAAQPLVIWVEDLHWCDASSLELLGRIVAQSPTARVLVVATARPEFVTSSAEWVNVATLPLGRLTRSEALEMVAGLGGAELSRETIDVLVTRADGMPLYVEELTKAVVEPGAARGVEAIPATLADSLMARLDRLSAAKEVAQRAAVLGREFSYALLAAVAGLEEAALRHGLARLVEAEVVFVRGEPPQATYSWKHALLQETAYASLLKRTRRELHGRVVDLLEATFPERAAAEPEVVARHAEGAGRADAAIAYYQRAGEHAQARSAHEEAIQHLRRAIALLAAQPESGERDAREVALQLALGGSFFAARGFGRPECEAAYDRARVLCDAVGDARRLGLALVGLAAFYCGRGEIERGRQLAARLLAAAEQSGDRELALHGHLEVSIPEFYQGRFASALVHTDVAWRLYEPERHHAAVAMVGVDPGVGSLAYVGWSSWQLGWPDRGLARAREAVGLARRLGHPFSLAFALLFETAVTWLRRDVTSQRERAAETIALAEAQGFPLWLGAGRTYHAAARVAAGDAAAIADLLAGLALAAEAGNQAGAPGFFALLGEACLAAQQLAAGRDAVATGRAVAGQTGQAFWDADLLRLEAELALVSGGATAEAEAVLVRALGVARAQDARSFELRVATSLARLWRDQGRGVDARALLAPTYRWFTEGFDTGDLRAARTLLDELR